MPPFTETEPGVLKLLNYINTSRAGGPDGLPARVLKELATEIAPVLTTMYRIKPEELYILSFEKGRSRMPRPFSKLGM